MIWGLIGSYTGEAVVAVIVGAVILLKFRRYRAVAAAVVGVFSSAATVVAGVIGVLVLLIAAGYWEPPIGQIVGDILGGTKALWNLAGEWVVSNIVEALEGVAE